MAKQQNKKWIQGAISRPGEFTRKAEEAGMTPLQYAHQAMMEGSQATTLTKQQANLYLRLHAINRKRKKTAGG